MGGREEWRREGRERGREEEGEKLKAPSPRTTKKEEKIEMKRASEK